MAGFVESPRFLDEIAVWAVGGRSFNVVIVQTFGGQEYRNKPWLYGLGKWTFQNALRQTNPLAPYPHTVLRNLLMGSAGELGGFRFKDYEDYQDEAGGVLGTTGLALTSTLIYQMFKNYTYGSASYQGIILKPVAATIKVYDNAVLKATPADYTLDSTTGKVTFASQPTVGHALTWTGEYDIPVRLDGDDPQIGLTQDGCFYDWPNLKLVELRNP